MAQEIREFTGGKDSTREHLNLLVREINALRAEVDAIKADPGNPLRVRVNNLDNTRQLVIEIKDALIIQNDPLFCCSDGSGSDGAHGGA